MEVTIKVYKDSFNNSIKVELGNFPILIKEKDTCFAAFIPHFKTLGFGKTQKDAISDLKEALDTFFEVHIERGSVEKALSTLGWKKESDTFKRPKYFNSPYASNLGIVKNLTYA